VNAKTFACILFSANVSFLVLLCSILVSQIDPSWKKLTHVTNVRSLKATNLKHLRTVRAHGQYNHRFIRVSEHTKKR